MYELERELRRGDETALYELAEYFDSKTEMVVSLGPYRLRKTEREVAMRIADENCMFLRSEFVFHRKIKGKDFIQFLQENRAEITFSKLADAFVITPFEERSVTFELTALTEKRKNELHDNKFHLMNRRWVTNSYIGDKIRQKDPEALLQISAALLRGRNRFNRKQWNESQYIDLLELLTQTSIAVADRQGHLDRQIGKDYFAESRINLLIFFATHYKKYRWDEEQSAFVLPGQPIKQPASERDQFELLGNPDADIAWEAFMQLTTGDPQSVSDLADEYQVAKIKLNPALHDDSYRFLRQLAPLTALCREHGIDFRGTPKLREAIDGLRQADLSFLDRYKLENEIIDSLSMEDVTAFEYWSIVYGGAERHFSFSAGRILDVFYSRHWNEVVSDSVRLEVYIKKSAWYDNLYVPGLCNQYAGKFFGASKETLQVVEGMESEDEYVQGKIRKIIEMNKKGYPKLRRYHKKQDRNPLPFPRLEETLQQLAQSSLKPNALLDSLESILFTITYEQIGTALRSLEQFDPKGVDFGPNDFWKYWFLERDWGFFGYRFEEKADREAFLRKYESQSKYELYVGMLEDAASDGYRIDYKKPDGSLNYDKIYDMLKYDIAIAFVGGHRLKKPRHVFALIKVLEKEFGTFLGYPEKLCHSNKPHRHNPDYRAADWMKYLESKKLLQLPHDEPVSFVWRFRRGL